MRLTSLALSLACALPLTLAAHITFTIPPTALLPNPATLPPSTHATLFRLDSTLTAPITRRNTFDFADVTPGSYLYTVQCRDYTFPPLRVDVVAGVETGSEHVDVWQTFWGNEWGNKGEHRGSGTWARGGENGAGAAQAVVVETRPERTKDYYQERQGFDPLSFLKSPMILMGLFSLILIVGIPYITENMDEETKKEFEEIQAKNPVTSATSRAQEMKDFDMAGWLAGKTSGSS